jgi:mevalonate kinase
MISFQKSLYAKCILSGEHAVLRGSPALVFPLKKYAIEMKYQDSIDYFECKFSGPHGDTLKFLFWGLLEEALKRVDKKRSDLKGELELTSYLPLGGGLGASAAICVGVGYFLNQMGFVDSDKLFEFCRSLEDQFHGESSGVDIAISFYEKPIIYRRDHKAEIFNPKWSPKIYLLYSGKRGVTSECVNKVKAMKNSQPGVFSRLDSLMKDSVELCAKALSEEDSEKNFLALSEALRMGQECYEQWDLVPFEVSRAIDKLKSGGAVQCKLTGSGGGGYILSLWDKVPPKELLDQMVELQF